MSAAPPYRDEVNMDFVEDHQTRHSLSELSSVSSTSAVLEGISTANGNAHANGFTDNYQTKVPLMQDEEPDDNDDDDDDRRSDVGLHGYDEEKVYRYGGGGQSPSKNTKRILWVVSVFALGGWLLALFFFLKNGTMTHVGNVPFEDHSDPSKSGSKFSTGAGSGKAITFESINNGEWFGKRQTVSWIADPTGDDGMILQTNAGGDRGALVVEDVRALKKGDPADGRKTLVKASGFRVNGTFVMAADYWPSPDLKKVLIISEKESVWRHSFTGMYWIVDVDTQEAEPLDQDQPEGRVQLAQWSPKSDTIAFTRDNNLFIRDIASKTVKQVTKDGGSEFFYGIPDWVYEEEIFQDRIATWFSHDGQYLAFLQTNETQVPEYPLQFFIKHPSNTPPEPGEESYPDESLLKYPRPGSANPTVKLQFCNVKDGKVFDIKIDNDLPDYDRLITEIVWGEGGRVLIRSTNRESDLLKMIVANVNDKTGRIIREDDVKKSDGGWFEVSHTTSFIPSDPAKGRPHAGYIDTIILDGYDHLAYFSPLDNPEPVVLTSGKWEVVDAPSAVDLDNNLVYFVATKQGIATRHVYSVKLDGSEMQALPGVDEQTDAYWDASFSAGAKFVLLSYGGPGVPTQKIISTPGNSKEAGFEIELENNEELRQKAAAHDLPDRTYTTVHANGVDIPVLELRPPHFDSQKKKNGYPVVLAPYGGPGSQQVHKRWSVDFQAYLAATLGYIVLIVDGRGTGFQGRGYRCSVRGNLGQFEAEDQIAVAREWAAKPFVDAGRIAIWGWSYGGFLTLKTLEIDGGNVFSYGAAVAPVTDWRNYDSVYTERYMFTPEHNAQGYDNSTISDVGALANSTRFLIMHGTGDDNVHFQNSMQLLDRLDLAGVKNYDFHAFPDSDHSIYFHNARNMVYQRLKDWLINAFNGEFHELNDPKPHVNIDIERYRARMRA